MLVVIRPKQALLCRWMLELHQHREQYHRDSCSRTAMSSPASCWKPCPAIAATRLAKQKHLRGCSAYALVWMQNRPVGKHQAVSGHSRPQLVLQQTLRSG